MEGRYSENFRGTELVRRATRPIIEEGLEAEVRDALDRGDCEHASRPGGGDRNGLRQGRLKTAQGFIDNAAPQLAGTAAPFRSEPGHGFGEKAVPKLMFAAMTRAAERWRAVKITDVERRQMAAPRTAFAVPEFKGRELRRAGSGADQAGWRQAPARTVPARGRVEPSSRAGRVPKSGKDGTVVSVVAFTSPALAL